MKKKIFVGVLAFCIGLLPAYSMTKVAEASSRESVSVKIYTEQGDDWFKAMKKSTDKYGTLILKKMIPGKYRLELSDDDKIKQPILTLKARMYDEKGRKFKEKTEVEVSAYIDLASLPAYAPGDTEVPVGVFETDSNGEVKLKNVIPGMEYKIDVDDDASLSKKDDRPRMKVEAKIADSDWFDVAYARVDTTNTLYLRDVISGKYELKYKSGDADPTRRFNMLLKLRDDKGEKIREATKVKIYVYINDQKMPVGEFMTTKDGKIYLPNALPGKYKIDVK